MRDLAGRPWAAPAGRWRLPSSRKNMDRTKRRLGRVAAQGMARAIGGPRPHATAQTLNTLSLRALCGREKALRDGRGRYGYTGGTVNAHHPPGPWAPGEPWPAGRRANTNSGDARQITTVPAIGLTRAARCCGRARWAAKHATPSTSLQFRGLTGVTYRPTPANGAQIRSSFPMGLRPFDRRRCGPGGG